MKKLVTALGLLAAVAVATPARAHGDFSFAIGLPGFFGVFGSPPPPPPPVIYAPPVPYYPTVVYRSPYYGYGYRGWGHRSHGHGRGHGHRHVYSRHRR
jgi:hypothetical protein